MNKDFLKNPPNKYRPAPFWSWNEKLKVDETLSQIEEMEKAGIGGFFMHARGGLQTKYMSDEWFENIEKSSAKANEKGMLAWGYDENGWPSGFGAGAVNGLGVEYQQKYLRGEITSEPQNTERTITNIEYDGKNYHMYFDLNPFYVDVLDKKVIAEFLKSTHEKYIEVLGANMGGMTGFFTDEPQVSRNGCPWSFVLEKEYFDRYGEELTPHLHSLIFDIQGGEKIRYRFWKLVRDLFAESYNKQLLEWHHDHNVLYTGHMACEENDVIPRNYSDQIKSNGSAMAQYEYMDIPGMDHLNRTLASILTEMQLTSVANQLGKKQIMSETFALSGWNVSFEDLRWIYESQMVHGVNFLCQHLEGYSLRGIRKRDYPASLFIHQPWWKNYRSFNDMVSRIGYLLAEGEIDTNVLVLSNIESGWTSYLCSEKTEKYTKFYCQKLMAVMANLENHQVQYHLGDDRIIERYGKVEGNTFTVGTQNYKAVIVPPANCLGAATFNLLKKFSENGGTVIFTGEVPCLVEGEATNEVETIAKSSIFSDIDDLYTKIPTELLKLKLEYEGDKNEEPVLSAVRRFEKDNMTMYYLVNPTDKNKELTLTVKGKSAELFDAKNGDTKTVYFKKSSESIEITETLFSRGSLIFFVYDENVVSSAPAAKTALSPINNLLADSWQLKAADLNSLTLDYCDLYFEGEKKAESLPVNDVQEMACDFFKKVKTDLVFHFSVKENDFEKCMLCLETPEIFDITVNGKKADKKDLGYFHDKAFRLIDIRSFVQLGENEIRLSCDFEQSEAVYENIRKAKVFETEKNKLTYDMEIEAIYLVGDFAVKTEENFEALPKRALRVSGGFYLANAPETVTGGSIAPQGFPFFAGSMTFEQKVTLTEDEIQNRSLHFKNLSSNVTKVEINGTVAGEIMWQPYEVDISDLLRVGENTITLTVTGNLRNLLGPFHLKGGEIFEVGPFSFFHNSPLWVGGLSENWTDDYCFVEYGLFL